MGVAYNENKFEATRSKSYPSMENLSDKFSGLGVNGSSNSNDGLFQVIKAVEAAESTIKHQAEENNSLRVALQRRTEELERFKSDNSTAPRSHSDILGEEHNLGPYNEHQSVLHTGNQASEASLLDLHQTLIPHQSLMSRKEDCIPHARAESEDYFERPAYATLKTVSTGRTTADCGASSRVSSPSSRSLASSRYREEEYDLKFNLPGHGKITPKANNDNTLWNQDHFVKVREHEEEISQLRKHLADRAMKEAQIRNEKYVLEKRIADMRLAFDQQQQEIVEASSKAISYRQDIIEENIRLTYALQAAHQEISTYLSSMLPLLADYSLQPSTSDAQSIACNIKVLFKHLQEKLLVTEAKLKDSHYQLTPLGSDSLNHPSSTPQSPYRSTPQSPYRSIGTGATSLHRDMHDPIPQSYSRGEAQFSSADAQTPTDWDRMALNTHPFGLVGLPEKNLEQDKWGRSSPISRITQDIPASPVAQRDSHAKHFNVGAMGTQLSFKDLVTSSESDSEAVYYHNGQEHSPHYQNGREHLPHYQNGREHSPHYQHGREPLPHWGSRNSPYMDRTPDDPNSASPHLPPVHEETSSSFSEEDDPLPGIEGLQISGEALPGRELQACGYSINGTTSCNFEWVRYLEDGSVNYIDGAKQPNYLVTADDVDSYLAIEVQPLDNRKRKGELVKVFANDQRKITCDSEMQERLEKTLYSGHASFEVSLAAGYLEIWEPAILAIKRVGYSIKCNGPRGVVVTEKFSPRTDIVIPYGHASTFTIIGGGGIEHLLRTNDDSQLRDIIVLTMRLFIMRAVEKRSGKRKKGRLFFNK